MATEDLTSKAGWEAFIARHGGLVGQPSKTSPDFDPTTSKRVTDPFYKYTMQDGSTVEINGAGQINGIDEKSPSQATGTAQPTQSNTAPTHIPYTTTNADGSTDTTQWLWDPNAPNDRGGKGAFVQDKSIPVEHKPAPAGAAGNKPPSDVSTWVPIHADPKDPNSKVIAVQDPNNSANRVSVPEGSTQRPTVVQGDRGAMYSWDGTTLKPLIQASPEKRQIVQGAGGSMYAWDGTTLTTLQQGDQPKNGDTMTDVVGGKYVTKTYQNGQWGVTNVGASADPNAGKEGDTRNRIQGGYNTTETYRNGEWITTAIGSKATPTPPTQITAGADQQNIVTMDDQGRISSQPSPNFQPKTMSDVAARIGQIQTAMQAKRAQVQGQVGQMIGGKQYTAQDALNDFNAWYDQNVAPQQQQLNVAQQQALFTQAKDLADTQRQNYTQAMTAGSNAVKNAQSASSENYLSQALGAIGSGSPNWGALNAVKPMTQDYNQIALQATQDALKNITPSNLQQFSPMDIAAMLGRDQYAAPGVPAPAATGISAPAPAAAGAAAVPGNLPGQAGNPYTGLSGPQNAMLLRPQPGQPGNLFQGLSGPGNAMPLRPWDYASDYSYS